MKTRTKVVIAAAAAVVVALSATAVAASPPSGGTLEAAGNSAGSVVAAKSAAAKGGVVDADSVAATRVMSGMAVSKSMADAGESLILDEKCLEFLEGEFIDDAFFDEELSQAEIDEINAEGVALAEALDAAGISYEMVTDELGISYPEWDWNDPAAEAVVDQFYEDLYGDDEWSGGDLPQELIDEINAENAALAAAFDAAGISYEAVTDESGIEFIEWNWDDDAANEVAEQVFEDLYGDEEWFDEELPQEVVDEINAEGAALADALDAAGIAYEMVTDESGITYPEWDWDDPAAEAVVDEFYTDLYGDWDDELIECIEELPQEIIDEINAEGAALAEALDAAGVAYDMVTDELGVTYPEWDWDDPAAEAVVDGFFEELYGEWEDDFFLDMELPQDLIDEINAEGAALAEAFDAAGVAYEMVTDESGVTYPEWDWTDDAANEVAKAFFGELDGSIVDVGFGLLEGIHGEDFGKVVSVFVGPEK